MFCDMAQFTELKFCGPHTKPHGIHALGNNYYVRFDHNLGDGKCNMCCIPCAYIYFITILDHIWIPGMEPNLQ